MWHPSYINLLRNNVASGVNEEIRQAKQQRTTLRFSLAVRFS
ncbi:hypothetical protein DOT_2026 [Desulfosporosinus sp. OT]|nr:hypothetical protein DOT_2026 [Desulfosporosinus sp. OT]